MDVRFSDDSKSPNDSLGCGSEVVEFSVGEGLGWGDNDAVASMDSHWIEIFHVADDGAVVLLVAHDLVLDLLPLVQIFFD